LDFHSEQEEGGQYSPVDEKCRSTLEIVKGRMSESLKYWCSPS